MTLYIFFYLAGAIALGRGSFSERILPTVLSDIACNGSESNILECGIQKPPSGSCDSFEDAAVVCQGSYSLRKHKQ